MAEIQKGKISTIEASPVDKRQHPRTARVLSLTGGSVTMPLIIPWYLRGEMGNLKSGDLVVYALFEDMTGWIIGRFDGDFQDIIPYDPTIIGDTIFQGNTSTTGNVDVAGDTSVVGNVSGADFISAEYGSSNAHKHTDSQGGDTTPPN